MRVTIRPIALVTTLMGLLSFFALDAHAQPIASEDLEIRGMSLELVTTTVDANLGSPSYVQTRFGGKTDDAPVIEGLVAEGDLVGPDIADPVTLQTVPGRRFEIPGLSSEGEYYLQNVRLVRDGTFAASALPNAAVVRVSRTLSTEVRVRQLSADDLRQRGIVVDTRNYDV